MQMLENFKNHNVIALHYNAIMTFYQACNECRTKSGFIQLVIFYGLIAIFLFAFIIGIGIVISYAMSTGKQPTTDSPQPGNTVKTFIDPTMLLDDPTYQAEKIVSIYSKQIASYMKSINPKDHLYLDKDAYLDHGFLTFRSHEHGFLLALKPNSEFSDKNTALEVFIDTDGTQPHRFRFDWQGMPIEMTSTCLNQLTHLTLDWKGLDSAYMKADVTELEGIGIKKTAESEMKTKYLVSAHKDIEEYDDSSSYFRPIGDVLRSEDTSTVKNAPLYNSTICKSRLRFKSQFCNKGTCQNADQVTAISTLRQKDRLFIKEDNLAITSTFNALNKTICDTPFCIDNQNSTLSEINIEPLSSFLLPSKISFLYKRLTKVLNFVICPTNVFRNNLPKPETNSSKSTNLNFKMLEINSKASRNNLCKDLARRIPNTNEKLGQFICLLGFDFIKQICDNKETFYKSEDSQLESVSKLRNNHVIEYDMKMKFKTDSGLIESNIMNSMKMEKIDNGNSTLNIVNYACVNEEVEYGSQILFNSLAKPVACLDNLSEKLECSSNKFIYLALELPASYRLL